IVFPWERDGWTHLYSVGLNGGKATLLTPGEFEGEDVAPAPGRREILFSSNQNDIDRRHLWKVVVSGGTPAARTSGEGVETQPIATSDPGVIAFLRSDAKSPLRPAIRTSSGVRDIEPLPADFPSRHMVTPQAVIFSSGGGISIHGQLFLLPNRPARAPAVV